MKTASTATALLDPRRTGIEPLEGRIAPAGLSQTGTVLSLILEGGEQVVVTRAQDLITFTSSTSFTDNGGLDAGFTISGVNNQILTGNAAALSSIDEISLTDSGPGASVVLASASVDFDDLLTIDLAQAQSGDIRFTAPIVFTADLDLSTSQGRILSSSTAALQFLGSSVSLFSQAQDVILLGSTETGGSTHLTLHGERVFASNLLNDLAGPFTVQSKQSADVRTSNALLLSTGSSFGNGSNFESQYRIRAGGNVTQDAFYTLSSGRLSIQSDNGSINLPLANLIDVGTVDLFAMSVGADATLVGLNQVNLGTIRVADQLSVSAGDSLYDGENSSEGIYVGGPALFAISNGGVGKIDLSSEAHRFGGTVTFQRGTGSLLDEVSLRNTLPSAQFPTFSGIDLTNNELQLLSLNFEQTAIALPDLYLKNLTVIAGGAITQSGTSIHVTDTADFEVFGNHSINLSAAQLEGPVLIHARESSQNITLINSILGNSYSLILDQSEFGRGRVFIEASDVSQVGPIQQQLHAGTFQITSTGSSVFLDDRDNIFTGPVTVIGSGVTSVELSSANPLARMADFTLPAAVTTLEVRFAQAPLLFSAALPASVTSLTASGNGISQTVPLTLNNASFDAGPFAIILGLAANQFTNLNLSNSGLSQVFVNSDHPVNLTGVEVGSGRLEIRAKDGDLTQSSPIIQEPGATRATFVIKDDGSIVLGDSGNEFTGPVYLLGNDSNFTLNTLEDLQLGNIVTDGDLTILGAQSLNQAAGTKLTINGRTALTVTDAVDLQNSGNVFGSTLSVTATNGVSIFNQGSTQLGNWNVGSISLHSKGAISQQSGAAIIASGESQFSSGTAAITLTEGGNDFGTLSLTSLGSAAVEVTDSTDLELFQVRLGTGAFTATVAGQLSQTIDSTLSQAAGGGGLTFQTGAGSKLDLRSVGNDFSGTLTVIQSTDVTIYNRGNLSFNSISVLDGGVSLTAGGQIDLSGLELSTGLESLATSARQTTLDTNLVASDFLSFHGGLKLNSATPLSFTAMEMEIAGNVSVASSLTVDVSGVAALNSGTWLSTFNLAILNGSLRIGGGSAQTSDPSARLILGSATTLSSPKTTITANGILQIGSNAKTAETATLDLGAGSFQVMGGALQFGLGATPDQLVVKGNGVVDLGSGNDTSRLLGTGLAPVTETSLLIVDPVVSPILIGHLSNTLDLNGNNPATFFFTGQDVAAATYSETALSIHQYGTASITGTVSLFTADGDKLTVSSTLGASAGLVVLDDQNGEIVIVVRNNAATSTLTLTTLNEGGNGWTELHGLGVNGAGQITINAASADLYGSLLVEGPLNALSLHDVDAARNGFASSIISGGSSASITKFTAHVVSALQMEVAGTLNLKAANFSSLAGINEILAQRFGTIEVTGDTVSGIFGDLFANLTTRPNASGSALVSASLPGYISGDWDLHGAIGKIKATDGIYDWNLGASGATAHFPSGTGVTDLTTLEIGYLSTSDLNLSGSLGTLKAVQMEQSSLRAKSFGSITVTGNGGVNGPFVIGTWGELKEVTIQATGANATGLAIGSLKVNGNWTGQTNTTTLITDHGNVGSITVGRSIEDVSILLRAEDPAAGGKLTTLKAGALDTFSLDARSVGTISVVGNDPAAIFGNCYDTILTLRGNAGGTSALALGKFSVQRDLADFSLEVLSGNVGAITVGRAMFNSSITLADPTSSALTSIQAAHFSNVDLSARTIGAIKGLRAPQVSPESELLEGDFSGSINAYLADGSLKAAITTLALAGDFSGSINAPQGITSFSVGRSIDSSSIVVDGSNATIAKLTVGSWSDSSLSANRIGTAKILGFIDLPSLDGNASGSLIHSDWVLHATSGLAMISLGAQELNDFNLIASGAITSISSANIITFSSISLSGSLGSLTAGNFDLTDLSADSITTLKIGVPTQYGGFLASEIYLRGQSAKGVSIASFSVAGDLLSGHLLTAGTINSFSVSGTVGISEIGVGLDPSALADNSIVALPSVKVGAWLQNDLVARSIKSFAVTGNSVRGLVGDFLDSTLQVFGSNGAASPIGLGSFSATGSVENSLIEVIAANLSSFAAKSFRGSDLLVGATMDTEGKLSTGVGFNGSFTLGSFKTSASVNSFADSNVVAAELGTVSIASISSLADVNLFTEVSTTENFGFVFAAATANAQTANGAPLIDPTTIAVKFTYSQVSA